MSRTENPWFTLFNRWMPGFRFSVRIPRLLCAGVGFAQGAEVYPDEVELCYGYLRVWNLDLCLGVQATENPGFRPWLRGWLRFGKNHRFSFDRVAIDISDKKNPMMLFRAVKLVLTKNEKPIRDLWVINKCQHIMEDPSGFFCEMTESGKIGPPL